MDDKADVVTKRGLVTRSVLSVPEALRCRESRIDPVRFCLFTRAIAGEVDVGRNAICSREKEREKKDEKEKRNQSLIRATTYVRGVIRSNFSNLPSQLCKKSRRNQVWIHVYMYAAVLDLARLDTFELPSAGVGKKHQGLGCGEDQTGSRPVTRRPGSDPPSIFYTVTSRQDLFFHKPALQVPAVARVGLKIQLHRLVPELFVSGTDRYPVSSPPYSPEGKEGLKMR